MDTSNLKNDPKHFTGAEPFHQNGGNLSTTVGDFWRWACSDLLSRPLRGVLAEFLVAKSLGCAPAARQLGELLDLTTPNGLKVEVLSASFLKEDESEPMETAHFAPASSARFAATSSEEDSQESADIRIYCLLKHRDKKTVDPLDVTQWQFFVRPSEPASVENERPSVEEVLALNPQEANFWTLPTAVNRSHKTTKN